MSETAEIEQLAKKRSKLEDEWSSLVQKERTLEGDVKALEERLAAQLAGKIEAKNPAVERLESTKLDLERRLKELQENAESYRMPNAPQTEAAEQEEEPQEQPTEMTVEAAADSSYETAEEETKGKSREEKRRKWL